MFVGLFNVFEKLNLKIHKMSLTQEEWIIIICGVGIAVLIIFGLLLWLLYNYCKKRQSKSKKETQYSHVIQISGHAPSPKIANNDKGME